MVEHLPRNVFDIPKLFYFQAGNVHTGSRKQLRYRVEPADGILHIEVWREDICYELAKERGIIGETAEQPITEEGFQGMLDFLQAEFEK